MQSPLMAIGLFAMGIAVLLPSCRSLPSEYAAYFQRLDAEQVRGCYKIEATMLGGSNLAGNFHAQGYILTGNLTADDCAVLRGTGIRGIQ